MRADNTQHLLTASRRRAEHTRLRAVSALRRMDTAGVPITFEALAREAGISRSWLYAQHDLRAEIQRLRARHHPPPTAAVPPDRQRASNASLPHRLRAATDRITQLEDDNRRLRDALATALGHRRHAAILGHPDTRDTPNKQPPESDRTPLRQAGHTTSTTPSAKHLPRP
ncbi:MAG: DUF6262 family protein [Pseudonocardia sp.]